MIVRKMHPAEFDLTVNLFGYYRDEAVKTMPHIDEEYDENSVIETIRLYNSHHEYGWFNAYEGQRPVGLIAGCITQTPWNKNILNAHIDMIFLIDSHRNMENFRSLYNEFEAWARGYEARKITAGDIGINPDRTRKVYGQLGFVESAWMIKEIVDEFRS